MATNGLGVGSQSPDGDFFDPEEPAQTQPYGLGLSQSPDGDFFDPEFLAQCGVARPL